MVILSPGLTVTFRGNMARRASGVSIYDVYSIDITIGKMMNTTSNATSTHRSSAKHNPRARKNITGNSMIHPRLLSHDFITVAKYSPEVVTNGRVV